MLPPAFHRPPSSYEGYNLITDAKGPQASEIAVYGKRWGIPGGILCTSGGIRNGDAGQSDCHID